MGCRTWVCYGGVVEQKSDQILGQGGPAATAYPILCSFVPEPEVLKEFLTRWVRIYVADLCAEVEHVQAKRTCVHKIDGNYKMARVVQWPGRLAIKKK